MIFATFVRSVCKWFSFFYFSFLFFSLFVVVLLFSFWFVLFALHFGIFVRIFLLVASVSAFFSGDPLHFYAFFYLIYPFWCWTSSSVVLIILSFVLRRKVGIILVGVVVAAIRRCWRCSECAFSFREFFTNTKRKHTQALLFVRQYFVLLLFATLKIDKWIRSSTIKKCWLFGECRKKTKRNN